MNYVKINKCDVANGPGVRVVLWISGCTCYCPGCHNQKLWDFNYGKKFDENAKEELFEALSQPWVRGLTLSGGHPLEYRHIDTIIELLKEVREKFPTKDIWLYTGNIWEKIINIIDFHIAINYCDVVVDGPFIADLKDISLKFRGSSNQRIIDVKKSLTEDKVVLYNE